MKRIIQRLAKVLGVVSLLIGGSHTVYSQVNFSVMPVPVGGEISREAGQIIYDKTVAILTRNSAAAAGAADVFAVGAQLTVGTELKSSGMVRDVTSITGELMLVAVNRVDQAKYYSVTVPLKAVVKGQDASPVLALAKSIKPTDAVFTRFVRLAREKVDEYYSDHCSEVLARAQTLAASGQVEVAMIYLTGVPPSAPCHEEAVEYIAAFRGKLDRDHELAEAKEEEREEREFQRRKELNEMPGGQGSVNNDSGNNQNNVPVEEDYSEPAPAPAPAPAVDPAPASPKAVDAEIYVESPNWKFKLTKAEYLTSARKIKLTAAVTYVGKNSLEYDQELTFRQAVDSDGENYNKCYVEGSRYRSFPDNVPVKIEYFIDNVKRNPVTVPFIGLSIAGKKIEIRNLHLTEQ